MKEIVTKTEIRREIKNTANKWNIENELWNNIQL